MRQLKLGKVLLLAGALLALSGCPRQDPAPTIEVCILDGHGGGDCVEPDGSKKYRLPSEMLNYWATNQHDEASYAGWCTGGTPSEVQTEMNKIQQRVY